MLSITVTNNPNSTTIFVDGTLTAESMRPFLEAYAAVLPLRREVIIDLSGVCTIDDQGWRLLAALYRQGSILSGTGIGVYAALDEMGIARA